MPSVRASQHRTPFLIHSSTAKKELYMNRRGWIHFRASGMRRSHQTSFRVVQVHTDHVQIIDEKKQADWNDALQSEAYQSTLHELRDAVQHAQMAFDQSEQVHHQSLCKRSNAAMKAAAKKLRKAKVALQTFQTPDYYFDVLYDSVFSFQFALDNGLSIMY